LVSKYPNHFAQDNEHYANIAPLFLLQMPLLFGPFCYPQLQQLQNQYAPLQPCKSKFFSMIVLSFSFQFVYQAPLRTKVTSKVLSHVKGA
jgi:hypothetical protein